MKLGYLTTDFQFIGLQVGGQVASGAQGVYAVLPYEVGISYTPLPAPVLTLKYRWDSGLYVKGAAQRSGEPGSEEAALHRDAVGLRFLPHGDKFLGVGEFGFNAPPAPASSASGSASAISATPRLTSACAPASSKPATTAPISRRSPAHAAAILQPARGVYVGASAMFVPRSSISTASTMKAASTTRLRSARVPRLRLHRCFLHRL